MISILKNRIVKSKTYKDLFDIPREILENKPCTKSCGKGINIVILNTPCNGFGDLMFAHKLAAMLRSIYNCRVDIASTIPESLKLLGESVENIIALKTRNNDNECRRFQHLDNSGLTIKYDLLFVAPVNQDYSISYRDIKLLIPYSNRFNTFFFSEYNDDLYKEFDFPTGVGKGYYGLLITKPKIKKITRKYKYALAYIAGDKWTSQIPLWRNCILGFVTMVAKKHKTENIFEVIGPEYPLKYIFNMNKERLNKFLGPYFGTIKFIDKKKKRSKNINNKPNMLILNASVFPVPNPKMLSLMKYSVKDILLTGDQSITDGLSCCPTKNIWYQTVPWKYDFVDNLASEMPNKYLKDERTSCGNVKTTMFNSNYKTFISNNNFSINARKKLNGIILTAKLLKNKKSWVYKYENKVLDTRGIRQFKNNVGLEDAFIKTQRKKRKSKRRK